MRGCLGWGKSLIRAHRCQLWYSTCHFRFSIFRFACLTPFRSFCTNGRDTVSAGLAQDRDLYQTDELKKIVTLFRGKTTFYPMHPTPTPTLQRGTPWACSVFAIRIVDKLPSNISSLETRSGHCSLLALLILASRPW